MSLLAPRLCTAMRNSWMNLGQIGRAVSQTHGTSSNAVPSPPAKEGEGAKPDRHPPSPLPSPSGKREFSDEPRRPRRTTLAKASVNKPAGMQRHPFEQHGHDIRARRPRQRRIGPLQASKVRRVNCSCPGRRSGPTSRRDASHLGPRSLPRFPQIISRLHRHPHLGARTKRL